MAATASSVRRDDVFGNLKVTVTDVTFDSAYPSGGEAVTAADLGLHNVYFGVANIKTTAAAGNTVDVYVDPQTDGSVLLKANAAAAEVGAVDLSTLVVQVVAFGY